MDRVHATTAVPARTLGALAVVGVLLAVIEAAVLVDADATWLDLLFPAVALHYWLSGLVIAARRPANGTGALLLLVAFALFLTQLPVFGIPALSAIGLVLQTLCLGAFLHVVLALPGGRLESVRARRIVVAAYALVLVGNAHTWLLTPGPEGPGTVLRVAQAPDLHEAWRVGGAILYGLLTAATAWELHRRRQRLPRSQRRTIGPLYAYGIAGAILLWAAPNVGRRVLSLDLEVTSILQVAVLAGLPIVLLVAMRRGGFAQVGGVEGLARALGAGNATLQTTQARLAAALGDPSARLAVRDPRTDVHLTPAGEPFLPGAGAGRASVPVRREGEVVGAIEYDAALGEDPANVTAAAEVLGLALERERLTVRLQLSAQQVLRSRERVVEAADRERRRIAQDLHDGLQGRLVLLAIRARSLTVDDATQMTDARALHEEIDAAIDELRGLVQGVMPSALIERDLGAAIDDLVDRMPLPVTVVPFATPPVLPSVVESTLYFVVAEAFANAIKHAEASRLRVWMTAGDGRAAVEVDDDGVGGAVAGRGLGLPGLQDRVDALGGTLTIDSPPGDGTRIHAEVPCGS